MDGRQERRKLTDEDIRRVRRLAANGDLSHQKIADAFDVTRAYVSLVVNGHRRVEAGGPGIEHSEAAA